MTAPLETYLAYFKARNTRMLSKYRIASDVPADLNVEVMRGLHAGSTSLVKGGTASIGGDPDSDVMLLDDDLDGVSLSARVDRTVVGSFVTLSGTTQGATVNGVSVGSDPERLPCEVGIGGVTLRLSDPAAHRRNPRQTPLGRGLAVVAVAGVIGAVIVALAAGRSDQPMPQLLATNAQAQVTSGQNNTPAAQDWLTAQIEAAGLDKHLTVSPRGSAIATTGALTKTYMRKWRGIHAAYDSMQFPEVLLTTIQQAADLPTVPPIATVRLGTKPALILASGTELEVGDTLTEGWTLQEIDRSGMTVERRNERLKIDF